MATRKKSIKTQDFKHQEIASLAERENSKVISLEQPSVCVIEQSQEILGHSNINVATTSSIPTHTTNEKGTKKTHDQMEGMDVDSHSSSKRSKIVSVGKDIVVLDLKEYDNRSEQGGKEGCLIKEEMSRHNESCDASSSEQTISQFSSQSQPPPRVLNLQSYSYIDVNSSQFRSKNDLLEKYSHKRFQDLEENQRLLKEIRNISSNQMSLLTNKDPTRNVLNLAFTEEEKVTEVKIKMDKVKNKMDKVNIHDKIMFHKKTNEMLYYDLLHMSLNKNKLENEVERLEK